MPRSHSAAISAGMSSSRYSRGTPIFSPLTGRPSARAKSGVSTSSEVESFGSWPAIEVSRIAASSTVLAIGPAWSSEEAKATMPKREQRP